MGSSPSSFPYLWKKSVFRCTCHALPSLECTCCILTTVEVYKCNIYEWLVIQHNIIKYNVTSKTNCIMGWWAIPLCNHVLVIHIPLQTVPHWKCLGTGERVYSKDFTLLHAKDSKRLGWLQRDTVEFLIIPEHLSESPDDSNSNSGLDYNVMIATEFVENTCVYTQNFSTP